LNFYLVFIRFQIHQLKGGSKDDYQWVSGWPIIGSALVAVSLFEFWGQSWIGYLALILILIDLGGLHWFIGSMVFQYFNDK